MKRKTAFILLFLSLIFSQSLHAVGPTVGLMPYQDSSAYQQYQKRPKNDLSKILYLMDRFKGAPLKVIYDQTEYETGVALQYARDYVAKHYHKENAVNWVRENAYRSVGGSVIYVKYPDGKKRELREALVEELKQIEK